jgi:hypothetical protein
VPESIVRQAAEEVARQAARQGGKAGIKQLAKAVLRKMPVALIIFAAADYAEGGWEKAAKNAVIPGDLIEAVAARASGLYDQWLEQERARLYQKRFGVIRGWLPEFPLMRARKRSKNCNRAKPDWKYVDRYDVLEYRCGLRAGDQVRLRRDLEVKDWQGNSTGEVHIAGTIWKVLPGASDDPGVVFLIQPDGQRHAWDDDLSIYEWFERVEPADGSSVEDANGTSDRH